MKCLRAILATAVLASALVFAPAAMADSTHTWPVNGQVIRDFDPPATTYGTGHRGIDIAAAPGTTVVAPADGVVTFVGAIDQVPMITVTHDDGTRTTYQPVRPEVKQGQSVAAGQAIGLLQAGHAAQPCLHFGVRKGATYLDPLAWLGPSTNDIRLLPAESTVPPRTYMSIAGAANGWPVKGNITSGYGWRMHPILGTRSFHDGIDIGAACGTPVATPWAGVVTTVATSATAGHYVRVAHDGGLTTTYMHLSAVDVTVGAHLAAGQQLGRVGTTGRSTGCHLHFGTSRNGKSINPTTVLP